MIWLVAVNFSMLLTLLIVAGMSYLLEGGVSVNDLIIGFVTSLVVTSITSALIIYFLQVVTDLSNDNGRLNAIVTACPVPLMLIDPGYRIVMTNSAFTRIFGYGVNDVPTLDDWWRLVCPKQEDRCRVAYEWDVRMRKAEVDDRQFDPMETAVQCKNGTVKSVTLVTAKLGASYDGLRLMTLYDITDQVEYCNATADFCNLLQSVIETIPMRVFWKDTESRYLGCNSAFARDGGQSDPHGVTGKFDTQLAWREQAERYRLDDRMVIETGKSKLAYEESQITPEGKLVWLRTSKVPLRTAGDQVVGVLGVYEDISDRKKAEQELWLTKSIIDRCKTAFFRLSPSGQVQYVNDFACRALGYERDELIGLYPWDFDPDFHQSDWPDVWRHLQNHEVFNLETRHRRKDGTVFNVEVTGHYIRHAGDEFSFTFVQDITARKNFEKALRQKEGYLRALIDNFPFMVWLKDTESRFLAVNQVLAETLGETDPDQLVGKSDLDYSPKALAERYRDDDRAVLVSNRRKTVEEEHVDHLGERRWVETFKAPVVDQNGEKLGTVGFARDISERKKIETELRIAATAFESQEGMIITDAATVILKINWSFTKITGYTSEEAVGRKMNLLKSGVHDALFYTEMWDSIRRNGFWQGEIWNRRKNGDIYPEWLTITGVKDADGAVTHYVGTMIDITARKAIEERVHHLAHHDVLTDLPNRILMTDRLHQALAQARRDKSKLALMFLDLDEFKPVNDTLGHDVGDLLLKEVAYRLQSCVQRESDTISRLGGDEFVILLAHIEDENDAAIVADKIVTAIAEPFAIEQHVIGISTSIGIAIYPLHGLDVNTLMKVADNAMYQAKQAGRACFRLYEEEA